MRKSLYWFMMVVLLFACLHSGCGGSSGDSSSSYNPDDPTTTPDNPNTPTTPDNPSTGYDFSVMEGTWVPSNGSGTASGGGVNATLTLKGGQVSLTNATSGGSVQVSSNIFWDVVQGGSVLLADVRDNFGGSGTHTFTNVSGNTWRYSGSDSDGPYSTTITITSSTTATVERDGYYSGDGFSVVHFQMTYTITKQSSPTTPDNPATDETLNGTWRITAGTLTYDVPDNDDEANYVQGSASAEQFTLALSDAGDGSYVLSVSGGGVNEKEGAPYIKANFAGIDDEVRVVWGTSEDWKNAPSTNGRNGTFALNDGTYSAEFQSWIHDVAFVSYQLTNALTIRYTQRGTSIHGNDTSVKVELTLERVN